MDEMGVFLTVGGVFTFVGLLFLGIGIFLSKRKKDSGTNYVKRMASVVQVTNTGQSFNVIVQVNDPKYGVLQFCCATYPTEQMVAMYRPGTMVEVYYKVMKPIQGNPPQVHGLTTPLYMASGVNQSGCMSVFFGLIMVMFIVIGSIFALIGLIFILSSVFSF